MDFAILPSGCTTTPPRPPKHGYTAAATTYARSKSLLTPPTPGAPMSRLEGDICLVKRKLLTPFVQDREPKATISNKLRPANTLPMSAP